MFWLEAFFTIVFTAFQALSRFYVTWAIRDGTWWIRHLDFILLPLRLDVLREILENGTGTFLSHCSFAIATFGLLAFLHGCFELLFATFQAYPFVLAFSEVAVEANFTLHAEAASVFLFD